MELVKHETCQQYFHRRLSKGWELVSLEGYNAVLLSPEGNIRREIDLRNDVETLRPNAAGDSTQFSKVGAASNWECVDEESHDDDTTYVQSTTVSQKDLYNIEDSGIPGGATINKITLYWWVKRPALNQDKFYLGLKSDTTEDWGTVVTQSSIWAERSREFATDPNTSSAWLKAAIDVLQIGEKIYEGAQPGCRCTQVYVEVDYTPGPTPVADGDLIGIGIIRKR